MTIRRFLGLALLAFASAALLQVATHRSASSRSNLAHSKQPLIPAAARSLRPNYPYSVVAGGVYSPAELRKAVELDTKVHDHYLDFNMHLARLVVNQEDRLAYVSYRMNNRVFWTQKRLRIPKGEVLMTDGQNFCRTRCGNRLSDKPHKDVAIKEPPERVLSLPNFTPELLEKHEVELAEAPSLGDLTQDIPAPAFEDARLFPILPAGTQSAITNEPVWPKSALPSQLTILVPAPQVQTQTPATTTSTLPPTNGGSTGRTGTPGASTVPEPATITLAVAALAGGIFLNLRRKRV